MDANLLLWIGQVLLALALLGVGYSHSIGFEQASARPGMGWMAAVGRERMMAIGILEILGAIGLIGPAVTGILPWLTPLAAASFALLMVFAIALHARRPGEGMNIVVNVVLASSPRSSRLAGSSSPRSEVDHASRSRLTKYEALRVTPA